MYIYDICIAESGNYDCREAFVSDLALSLIWYDDDSDKWNAEADKPIPQERIDLLGDLYDATHRSVREIAEHANMSQRKLAERFHIPYRTMEDWCRGVSQSPLYTRLMMQECLGFYDPSLFLKDVKLKNIK